MVFIGSLLLVNIIACLIVSVFKFPTKLRVECLFLGYAILPLMMLWGTVELIDLLAERIESRRLK